MASMSYTSEQCQAYNLTVRLIKSQVDQTNEEKESTDSPKVFEVRTRRTYDDKISLGDVVRGLREQGQTLNSCMLLYYNAVNNIFCHCCPESEADQYFIPLNELKGELQLKYRKITLSAIPVAVPKTSALKPEKIDTKIKSRAKRTKERKIGEIIDKVAEWRKLYTGIMERDGTVKKYTLEEAADIVGIAKKTLDDYLLQIRAGKKYGFDFNIHRESKVGVLRTFVKSHKGKGKGDDDNSALDKE